MKVIFSPQAKRELDDAISYYETQQPGLGVRFRDNVRKAVLQIAAHPMAWSIERNEIRKCLLHRFPYKLLYSIEPDHIFLIAVAHSHRRPDYWVDRV